MRAKHLCWLLVKEAQWSTLQRMSNFALLGMNRCKHVWEEREACVNHLCWLLRRGLSGPPCSTAAAAVVPYCIVWVPG